MAWIKDVDRHAETSTFSVTTNWRSGVAFLMIVMNKLRDAEKCERRYRALCREWLDRTPRIKYKYAAWLRIAPDLTRGSSLEHRAFTGKDYIPSLNRSIGTPTLPPRLARIASVLPYPHLSTPSPPCLPHPTYQKAYMPSE